MPAAQTPQIFKGVVIAQASILAPSALALTVDSDTEITLDWTDGATAGDILIERSLDGVVFEEIATVALAVETYQDTELEPETEYFYRIRAYYLPKGYSAYSDIESDTTDA